jgi:hypothetical protein
MGFNINILEGEISASANCMGPQFICTGCKATKYKDILKNRPFGTYNLNFAVTAQLWTTSPEQQGYV